MDKEDLISLIESLNNINEISYINISYENFDDELCLLEWKID